MTAGRAKRACALLLAAALGACGGEGREAPAADNGFDTGNASGLPVPKAEGRGLEDPAEPENNRYVPCPEGLDPKTGRPHVCAPEA